MGPMSCAMPVKPRRDRAKEVASVIKMAAIVLPFPLRTSLSRKLEQTRVREMAVVRQARPTAMHAMTPPSGPRKSRETARSTSSGGPPALTVRAWNAPT